MYFKLSTSMENALLHQPETGMGYQVVEASKVGSYFPEKFLVLNSEIVVEMRGFETEDIRKIMNKGIFAAKSEASVIALNRLTVLNENQFRDIIRDFDDENRKGAIENSTENADGEEMFVRLSAFDNDRRVDKINKCLLPGSFATTDKDCNDCRVEKDNPVEGYALPSNDEIKFVFYIQPMKTDTLQRGTVQPANDKRGGGKEVYFENGTSSGSFKGQINHF
jgi:hypothetical protein